MGPASAAIAMLDVRNTVGIWDLTAGRLLGRSHALPGKVTSIALDPASLWCAVGSLAGSVELLDVGSAREVARYDAPPGGTTCLAVSPDGRLLAAGGRKRGIRVWDRTRPSSVLEIATRGKGVGGLAFAPDARFLVAAHQDGSVVLHPLDSGREGPSAGEARVLGKHEREATAVDVHPSGTQAASAGFDHAVRTWTLPDGGAGRVIDAHTSRVTAAAFHPDGSLLASGGYDHAIVLSDPRTGREVARVVQHDHNVDALAFAPDGRLFSGGAEGRLRSLAAGGDRLETVLFEPDLSISAVAVSRDGRWLFYAASYDAWGSTRVSDIRRAGVEVAQEKPAEFFWKVLERYLGAIDETVTRELRRRGIAEYDRGDFLDWLIRRQVFVKFDEQKAKFRSFMQGVIRNYAHEAAYAEGRGGREQPTPPEDLPTEITQPEVRDREERRWGQRTFGRAVRRLLEEHPRDGFLLLWFNGVGPFRKRAATLLGEETGIGANACHAALHRARERLRHHLVSAGGNDGVPLHDRLYTAVRGDDDAPWLTFTRPPDAEPAGDDPERTAWAAGALDEAFRRLLGERPLDAYVLARSEGFGPIARAAPDKVAQELPALAGAPDHPEVRRRARRALQGLHRLLENELREVAEEDLAPFEESVRRLCPWVLP